MLDIIYILLYEMRSVTADAASDTYRVSSTVGGPCRKNKRVTTSLRFICFISLVAFVINHQELLLYVTD